MTDENATELKSFMWTTSKYVSVETGRRVPHQSGVNDYLSATCEGNVDFKNITFNQRIKVVKQELLEKQSSL